MAEIVERQNRAYYVKLWKTHGVIACTRGDQLGKGKTVLFLDPDRRVKVVGKAGEWFVNPANAIRAAQMKRDREIRMLKRRIDLVKAIAVDIRSW